MTAETRTEDSRLERVRAEMCEALAEAREKETPPAEVEAGLRRLESAREAYEQVRLAAEGEGVRVLGALARLGEARCSFEIARQMPPGPEAVALAERSRTMTGEAIANLSPVAQRRDYGDGLLLLARQEEAIGLGTSGFEREQHLDAARDALDGAEYLLRVELEGDAWRELRQVQARVAAARHGSDRDVSLCRAYRYAWEALGAMLPASGREPIDLPFTLLELGNALTKVSRQRQTVLARARDSYTLALEHCDPSRAPRLAQLLQSNVAWLSGVLDSGSVELPEKEMVERYERQVQRHLDRADADAAVGVARAMLAWSWSLTPVPNLRTAIAHNLVGRLLEQQGAVEESLAHRIAEVAVVHVLPDPILPPEGKAQASQGLLEAAQRSGRPHDPQALLAAAAGAFAASHREYVEGERARSAGKPDAARHYQAALGHFRFHPYALFGLGVCHMLAGQSQSAIALFTDALALVPRNVAARYNRAVALAATGRHAAAVSDLDVILDEHEDEADTRFARARSLVALERHEAAMADLDRLIEAEPRPELLSLRAECRAALGHDDEAAADLEAALALATDEGASRDLEARLARLKASG